MNMHSEPIEGLSRWRKWLVLVAVVVIVVGCRPGGDAIRNSGFDVMERSIVELKVALEAGEVTSRELVDGYLMRISAYDRHGPGLNAMLTLDSSMVGASVSPTETEPVSPDDEEPPLPPHATSALVSAETTNTLLSCFIKPSGFLVQFWPGRWVPVRTQRRGFEKGSGCCINIRP